MSFHDLSVSVRISVLLTVALGCSDVAAPTRPDDGGTFSARVSGGVARTFGGRAVFDGDVSDPRFGFAIALVDSSAVAGHPTVGHVVYLYRESAGTPPVGDYLVGPRSSFRAGLALRGEGEEAPLLCVAASGTVRVALVTAAGVSGTFDLDALCRREGSDPVTDTIKAIGSFHAVADVVGVPDEVTELPLLRGRFDLLTARGEPVPTAVFDGIILVGEDEFFHLEITVSDGYIALDGTGAYEHRVSQDVRVDGYPAPSLDWVDRGVCTPAGAELRCMSNLRANTAFTAELDGEALEITQDLNGEGLAVPYRYVPMGS